MYHRKKKRKKEMYSNLYIEEGTHYNSNIETEKKERWETISNFYSNQKSEQTKQTYLQFLQWNDVYPVIPQSLLLNSNPTQCTNIQDNEQLSKTMYKYPIKFQLIKI